MTAGRARLRRAVGAALCGAACWLAGCARAPAGAETQVLFAFGETGLAPGQFSYPRAAVCDPNGAIYIVDKSARIQCFAPDGTPVRSWQMPEYSAGKPTGLGVGPDGRIYVADTHYSRVLIYAADGTLERSFGKRGTAPGEFLLPTDVAVDRDGNVYVAEYSGNDRISRFDADGNFVCCFGDAPAGPERLQRPQALHIADDDVLWVADACNHRICRFTLDGKFLGAFGHEGAGRGEMRFPYSIDRLSDGTFVVAEFGNNRIQRFTAEGQSLGTWGSAGRRPGQVAYPWAAVVGLNDRVYVLDSGNNRVQVVDGRNPRVWQ